MSLLMPTQRQLMRQGQTHWQLYGCHPGLACGGPCSMAFAALVCAFWVLKPLAVPYAACTACMF